mgnify:CR=1 FL=1
MIVAINVFYNVFSLICEEAKLSLCKQKKILFLGPLKLNLLKKRRKFTLNVVGGLSVYCQNVFFSNIFNSLKNLYWHCNFLLFSQFK